MKKNKHIGMAMMAVGMMAAVSCTDFSDYNEVRVDAQPSSSLTLWENIQQNKQLTDFAAMIREAGFDDELSSTHYYTVWAPLNGTFDVAAYQKLGANALLRQFVYNHVADYGHNATGSVDEHVLMLNEKKHAFKGAGSYTFDGINISKPNQPSINGVMHIIDGVAAYHPHLYDFVTDSLLAEGLEIDSLRHFFQRYEHVYLDEEASVSGPMVNGMQTYIDSVMVVYNDLTELLHAQFDNEDSTYTFIMPTNSAWSKTYDKVKSFYQYIPTVNAQAFVTANGQTSLSTTPLSLSIDDAFMQDSITRRMMTRNLVFSNNDGYNQWLVGTPSSLGSDTLRTTLRTKLSNPRDILGQTSQKLLMSNGFAYLTDSLAFYPWETYAPERSFSAWSNRARIGTGYAHSFSVEQKDNVEQPILTYLWAEPSGPYAKPEINIYLPDVLSTTYDIYCVFTPAFDKLNDASYVPLPARVNFELSYCDANGNLQTQAFLNEDEANVQWCTDYLAQVREADSSLPAVLDNASNRTTFRGFSNDPAKVDSVYIGRFTFPVSYYGLGGNDDHICPNIKITSPFSVFNKTLMAAFSRDLRIAAIVLKPLELVEFEESKKQ